MSIIFYPANFTLSAQQGKNQFLVYWYIYFEYCGIHTTMKYENPFETCIMICAIAIVQFTLYTDPFRYKNYVIHFNVKCKMFYVFLFRIVLLCLLYRHTNLLRNFFPDKKNNNIINFQNILDTLKSSNLQIQY